MTAVDNHDWVDPKRGGMNDFALAQVARHAPLFPRRLERLSNPPAWLWRRGGLPKEAGDAAPVAVSVVGSRAASATGCTFARMLGRELGMAGLDVISGGAYGIDAAAHQGALDAAAPTFAVLGCGVDVVYPDRHADLFQRIATSGGLLSEHAPGVQPKRPHFPSRNRIIAALADAVVVVEAGFRSGALTTASLAKGLAIPVLAVPGSAGTDGLITRGDACEVRSFADVMTALAGGLHRRPRAQTSLFEQHWSQKGVPDGGRCVSLLKALEETASRAEDLSRRLGWSLAEVLGVLGEAEIEGWIRRVPGGAYEVTRGH
jgi:DNA processing protein